jgi:hypothetical protein
MSAVAVLTLVHTAISVAGVVAKVPARHDLAPTRTEPPFGVTPASPRLAV